MELRKSSILMMSAPAVGAFLLSAVLFGGIVSNTTDKFSESLGTTGYVVISVVRDGNEIYHFEDHNAITEEGVDFIIDQISGTPSNTVSAQYIGLTTTDITPDDDLASTGDLPGEITTNGLERAQGTVGGYTFTPNNNDDDDNYTVSVTFTATNTHTAVQGAGLFTDDTVGSDTLVAINEFSSVNLANGDQLTITWTIDLGAGLDA
jgi:hypothetical protein